MKLLNWKNFPNIIVNHTKYCLTHNEENTKLINLYILIIKLKLNWNL